jgi:hypothetical protein
MPSATEMTEGSTTCWGFDGASYRTSPFARVILITGVGWTCAPPYARVPYAEAISSVLTSFAPSTAAGTAFSGVEGSVVRGQQRIPMRCATSTIFCAPAKASPPPSCTSRLA